MKIREIKSTIESNKNILVDIVNKSNSYADLCRYYGFPNNGKQHKYFREILTKNGISTDGWNWHKQLRKYTIIEKECPVCKTKFITQLGHRDEKETCSVGCSNVYFSDKRHTKESKQKTSEGIRKYCLSVGKHIDGLYKIKCEMCGTEKETIAKNQRFCSNKCSRKYLSTNSEYISKLKAGVRKSIIEGRHKGWKSRNILSYPEKFFIKVLTNNDIKFETNKSFTGYFLDFAIGEKMIDLEIDGKQHNYPDRKTSDIIRDEILTKNGWNVYRIEWNNINSDEGKRTMKEKIDKFLEFYKTI